MSNKSGIVDGMAKDIGLMVKTYEQWRADKERLGTLDELARSFGVSKQILLYHVAKKRNGLAPSTRKPRINDNRDETTNTSADRNSPECTSCHPETCGDNT